MGEEIVDLADVMERVQNDKELLLELFDIFQEDFAKKREALGSAVASQEFGKIKELAHSLKGASGNISIKSMHTTCLQIEQLAKSNSTAGMDPLLKAMDEQYSSFKVFAANLKKEASAG